MATYLVRLTRSGPAWLPGRPLEEQSGWDEHAAYMDLLVGDGTVVLGGPLADDVQVALAVEAPSELDVRQRCPRTRGAAATSWSSTCSTGRSGSTAPGDEFRYPGWSAFVRM